jgi:flagellar P-ring protein precursor FlgI
MAMRHKRWIALWTFWIGLGSGLLPAVETPPRLVQIRDISTLEGVRENSLLGYGAVVGLNSTGDRRQTLFTTQTIANILQKMGLQVSPTAIRVNNVAAVFVTATLPPFARPGTKIDVTVSSTGDAKTLEGGYLLLTPLYGPDGQVYATGQGPVVLGGYSGGTRANSVQINHPTVGRVPAGGMVERDTSVDLTKLGKLSWLLRDADFTTAVEVAAAINRHFGREMARAVDGRRIEILHPELVPGTIPALVTQIENLSLTVHPRAKVVVNERTGTVVMGKNVSLGACSILHGNLAIEINTEYQVSQPQPFAKGETVVVPQTTVRAQESPAKRVELREGATVDDLINGLQNIGATARDIMAILEALKAAGALQAELEVI